MRVFAAAAPSASPPPTAFWSGGARGHASDPRRVCRRSTAISRTGLGDPAARCEALVGARSPSAPRRIAVGSVAPARATVGKALGPAQGMKGGFGFARLTVPGGVTVAAAVAVNAAGDVCDPANGRVVAGCRAAPDSLELLDARRVMAALPADSTHPWEGNQSGEPSASSVVVERPAGGGRPWNNTTLAAVLTDAALAKPALLKVARCFAALSHLARRCLYDGDWWWRCERRAPGPPGKVRARRGGGGAACWCPARRRGFGCCGGARSRRAALTACTRPLTLAGHRLAGQSGPLASRSLRCARDDV